MINIQCSSSNKNRKRTTILFVLACAAFAASGASYGAKPSPALNGTVCAGMDGSWDKTSSTCTIPNGTSTLVSSDLRIVSGVTLQIEGNLTIPGGVTIANSGTINVAANAGGALTEFEDDWPAGILVFGTLANSGTINIGNAYSEAYPNVFTAGITVSVSATNWNDPSTVASGTLTNSGTINIQNSGQTRGIQNLGTLTNSASGTITVANTGGQVVAISSVGIYNERQAPSFFYVNGNLTNAGSITISSSGDSNTGLYSYGYGIYNNGHFTSTGTFTIAPSPVGGDARGFYNSGNFTSYGTFINNRGTYVAGDANPDPDQAVGNWGSFNSIPGTMINLGTTSVGNPASFDGTFYNAFIMINLGTITSYGTFYDTSPGGALMINSGTFYNFGTIVMGLQKGICIDEPATIDRPAGTGC